jgi:hypothetical protein
MRRFALALMLAVLGSAFAGCGGGGGGPVAPTPGPTCGPMSFTAQLVYPAPGSTGISDSLPEVVMAVSQAFPPSEWNLWLYPNGSSNAYYTNYFFYVIPASQLPVGSASTTIANPVYELVPLSAGLPAKTTFQAAVNDTFSNCTPYQVPGATFTTQ